MNDLTMMDRLDSDARKRMQQAIRLSWMGNLEKFCQDLWPEAFTDKKMTPQRREYMRYLVDESVPQLAITAYRGFAKTTYMLMYLAYCAAFRIHPYIQYVSKSEDYSITQCQNLLQLILTNQRYIEFFGHMKPGKYEGVDLQFGRGAFYLADPHTGKPFMMVNPRGWEQQINGALVAVGDRLVRPTLQIIDDGEDREAVQNSDRRKKYSSFIEGTLFPCVSEERPSSKGGRKGLYWTDAVMADSGSGRGPWRRIYADTIKHNDAFIVGLLSSKQWVTLRYPKAERRSDGRYYSLVPGVVSDDEIRLEIASYAEKGLLDDYAREFLCKAQADESAVWTREMYRYYREAEQRISSDAAYKRYIIMDPARTAKKTSCPSAMIAVGVNEDTGDYYVRKLVHGRLEWPKQLDALFQLALETNTRWVGVEITGSNDILKHTLETEARRRGMSGVVQWVWLDGSDVSGKVMEGEDGSSKQKSKEARAETVFPLYQQGRVYHEVSVKNSALEREQLGYPENVFWDALDCAGYIPVMDRKIGVNIRQRERPKLPRHIDERDSKMHKAVQINHKHARRRAFM